jgi:hypothetical protein
MCLRVVAPLLCAPLPLASSRVAPLDFCSLRHHLETYHESNYLILDVNTLLSSCGCPDDMFLGCRLPFAFGPDACIGSGAAAALGSLAAAARIAAAIGRWWSADDSSSSTPGGGTSVVVLAAAASPTASLHLLSACALFFSHRYSDINTAFLSVLNAHENRLLAQLRLRSLAPSTRLFLRDFALVQRYDRSFSSPKVWLHEMRMHRLPQMEEEGTRLLITIIANGNQFIYTSQQQGGGHTWIPTLMSEPLTALIPLAVEFAGEASIQVYHLPEFNALETGTATRQLIFSTKIHSAVLCLPCWKIEQGEAAAPTAAQSPNHTGTNVGLAASPSMNASADANCEPTLTELFESVATNTAVPPASAAASAAAASSSSASSSFASSCARTSSTSAARSPATTSTTS